MAADMTAVAPPNSTTLLRVSVGRASSKWAPTASQSVHSEGGTTCGAREGAQHSARVSGDCSVRRKVLHVHREVGIAS